MGLGRISSAPSARGRACITRSGSAEGNGPDALHDLECVRQLQQLGSVGTFRSRLAQDHANLNPRGCADGIFELHLLCGTFGNAFFPPRLLNFCCKLLLQVVPVFARRTCAQRPAPDAPLCLNFR